MRWLKVIFVMVIVIQLDSIQNKITDTEIENVPINPTEILEMTSTTPQLLKCENDTARKIAYGCWNNKDLHLSFEMSQSNVVAKMLSTQNQTNCTFEKINGSFIASTKNSYFENFSFCTEYVFSSTSGEMLYYIKGVNLEEIQVCPEKSPVCVMEKPAEGTCPLKNFSVNAIYPHRKYVSLNISWSEIDIKDPVTVRILHKNGDKTDCFPESHIFNHSLLNNHILRPEGITKPEVNPGCVYDIFVQSEEQHKRVNCLFNYTVPDCVENKCDCDKFKPTPKILDVQHISENKFLVKWDPGKTTVNNITYRITEVVFAYSLSHKPIELSSEYASPKHDMEKHTSEIVMKLFDGDNYTLEGTFQTNISCPAGNKKWFIAPTKTSYDVFLVVLFSIGALALVVLLIRKKIPRYKNKLLTFFLPSRERNQQRPLARLQAGQIPMDTNTQYTPVEFLEGLFDEFEFPRNRIILKEVIGSGAFGLVYSAKALGIGGIDGYRMVAVKTLGEGDNITREATNDFIAEIEIFKNIGNHPNIVALLGCCTINAPYMMIMEFVPCGDLKNYLVELREQWLKRKILEKNKQFFFPENSDGAYIEPLTPTTPVSITSSRLPSTSETVSTTLDDPMTPLLSHYTHALERILDHTELQSFALQIARGMAHLEKIRVTHRDLAARNILINEYKVLKISDFGLSRNGPYINHKNKKLPLRWMAIEAIVEQKYDSKSDVWSFGVVLWEIGTLGAFPYESVPDSFLLQFLQLGRRLERPEICSDELYSLMQRCWATDPDNRPTFQELVEALDVNRQRIYVNFNQLNPSYVFPPSDAEKRVQNLIKIVDI